MTKHTQAPWVGFVDRSSGKAVYSIMPAGRPGEVASNIENEADASLLTAAPLMLAALRTALPHLDNSGSPGGCDGSQEYCDHCRAIRLVRSAIAQATHTTTDGETR